MKCQRCFNALGLDAPDTACPRCEGTGEMCEVCNGMGFISTDAGMIPCRCGLSERNAARSLSAQRMIQQLSILSGRLKHCGFGNFSVAGASSPAKAALAAAVKWATNPVGWLTVYGPMGNGKTHLAAAAANNMAERGHICLMTDVPTMLAWLRDVFRYYSSDDALSNRLAFLKNISVLILDDLGAEYHKKSNGDDSVGWADEQLYIILNHRYNNNLPTMIATNVSNPAQIDARIRDRVFSQEWAVVKNSAPSWRTGKVVDR